MPELMTILMILLYVALAFLVITAFMSTLALSVTFRKKKSDYKKRIYIETMCGNLDYGWYEKLPKEEFTLKSIHGYDIYGEMVRNKVPTDKTVVVMHGYGANLIVSMKYARIFLERGFNVLVFDNTNCGKSGGNMSFMGYREIDDLRIVVAKAREFFGENAPIGLHGESMGCATITKYLERDKKIAFAVADCGFTNLFEEFAFTLRHSYKMTRFPFAYLSSLLCKIRFGFFLGEFSPIDAMKNNDGYSHVPMLFVHGEEDDVVPLYMVKKLYDTKKGYKKLAIYKNAHHARCILNDRERYNREIDEFLFDIDELNKKKI